MYTMSNMTAERASPCVTHALTREGHHAHSSIFGACTIDVWVSSTHRRKCGARGHAREGSSGSHGDRAFGMRSCSLSTTYVRAQAGIMPMQQLELPRGGFTACTDARQLHIDRTSPAVPCAAMWRVVQAGETPPGGTHASCRWDGCHWIWQALRRGCPGYSS